MVMAGDDCYAVPLNTIEGIVRISSHPVATLVMIVDYLVTVRKVTSR